MIWLWFFLLLLLPAGITEVLAGDCTIEAATYYNVSPILIEAIQEVESMKNPYAISVQFYSDRRREIQRFKEFLRGLGVRFAFVSGKHVLFSVFPDSIWKARKILERITINSAVRTYDIGLMQINRFWIEKYNLNPVWLLDGCYNVKWGSYILSDLVNRYGYSWEAVWRYNGSKRYIDRVLNRIGSLCLKKYYDNDYCREYFFENSGREVIR